MFAFIRRLLFGRPLETARQKHERLPKFLALPVFASDAVSSNAYATEEILLAFALAGAGAIAWKMVVPITLAIVALLGIVVVSYRLTIFAYPQGGGAYIVTKENLGTTVGLVAAAALLTDYVMTVAVSTASGIAAIISAFPSLAPDRVQLCVAAIGLVALVNLRGLRESGTLFAIPTYGFILGVGAMILVGVYRLVTGAEIHPVHHTFPTGPTPLVGIAFWFVVLRAFAGGCAAMTGTEAVADGIPAFKPPESKNAAATLVVMASILAFLFIGISVLAQAYQAVPSELPGLGESHGPIETVVSQIARGVFGRSWFYYFIQIMTAAILILAANTAFQDFPRLSSILARDRFAPRQLANVGDRLVYSNGIVALAAVAAFLIWIFRGNTHALIPLYAVGVFVSFTLSQFSMSLRQRRLKQPGWRLYSSISLFGSIATGIVAVVVAVMKFTAGPKVHILGLAVPTGSYIVVILIPTIVLILQKIHQHYVELANQLRLTEADLQQPTEVRSTAIVLAPGIHRGIVQALRYAKTLSHDCRGLYIEIDPSETALVRERWEKYGLGVPLVILESPYRTVVDPVIRYLEEVKKERPDYVVTVVLPEFVPAKFWHKLLHNQTGIVLKVALMLRRDIVVTNVRYYLEK
ncbi:MAG: APC family permease [Armatimonadota bacterium]|nr:APC family permease [Armatimonadota bacterium]